MWKACTLKNLDKYQGRKKYSQNQCPKAAYNDPKLEYKQTSRSYDALFTCQKNQENMFNQTIGMDNTSKVHLNK